MTVHHRSCWNESGEADAREAGVDKEELEDIFATAKDGGIDADGTSATDATKAPVQAPESILSRLTRRRKG